MTHMNVKRTHSPHRRKVVPTTFSDWDVEWSLRNVYRESYSRQLLKYHDM